MHLFNLVFVRRHSLLLLLGSLLLVTAWVRYAYAQDDNTTPCKHNGQQLLSTRCQDAHEDSVEGAEGAESTESAESAESADHADTQDNTSHNTHTLITPAETPPTPLPDPVADPKTPLPECAYESHITAHHDLPDWQLTLLDTLYKLPADYAPNDLVSIQEAGLDDGQGRLKVRSFVIDDLKALAEAADTAGHPVAVQSAYRSYSYQARTFDYWVNREGKAQALTTSARAGHSEHQLGTALDFRSEGGLSAWDLADWADEPAGGWMVANSWRYGFILSYPKGQADITCYSYEPWHYRYVGRELAAQVHEEAMTLRQWLWHQQEH